MLGKLIWWSVCSIGEEMRLGSAYILKDIENCCKDKE